MTRSANPMECIFVQDPPTHGMLIHTRSATPLLHATPWNAYSYEIRQPMKLQDPPTPWTAYSYKIHQPMGCLFIRDPPTHGMHIHTRSYLSPSRLPFLPPSLPLSLTSALSAFLPVSLHLSFLLVHLAAVPLCLFLDDTRGCKSWFTATYRNGAPATMPGAPEARAPASKNRALGTGQGLPVKPAPPGAG